MTAQPSHRHALTDADYERLLEFRRGLRRFLAWSASEAARAGLTPSQHQLLLAIRGHHDHARGPTVGEVAGYLLVKHHSAAELAARAEDAGLVRRVKDADDGRVVRLELTRLGHRKLDSITTTTIEELQRLAPRLKPIWAGLR